MQRRNSNNTFRSNMVHINAYLHYSEDNFWAIPLFFLQLFCAYCQNTLFHLHCHCQIPWIKLIEIMMFQNKCYMFFQHDIFLIFFCIWHIKRKLKIAILIRSETLIAVGNYLTPTKHMQVFIFFPATFVSTYHQE